MSDPFADLFSNLTVGPGGAYADQPTLGATPIPKVEPGTAGTVPGQPVAPMEAKDDAWGLVEAYHPEPAAAPAPAPAPAIAPPPAAAPPPPPADGLPEGWTAYTDPSSGKEYFHHAVSGQVTWEKPLPPAAALTAPAPAAAPPAASAAADPLAVFGGTEPQAAADPFPVASTHSADSDGGAQSGPGVKFAEGTAAPAAVPEEDDFWAQMGFGVVPEEAPKTEDKTKPKTRSKSMIHASVINMPDQGVAHLQDDDMGADRLKGGLPSGKTYEAHLDRFCYRLGAVLLTGKQVRSNLYCKVSDKVIKELGNRPVVAYLSGDAAAHKAGIHPGEIVLKVGGKTATDPKQARELIQSAQRPLTLTMLRPDLPIIVGENQHMVKYNNSKPRAPSYMRDWKAKYCVVGGIAAKPYALLMYYSKADYDRAVSSNLAHRHPSVKIKAFDLRGCTLITNQTVHYPENSRVWHFFIIQQPASAEEPGGFPANNIKISHPVSAGLTPILEAVKRVIKKYPQRPRTYNQSPQIHTPDRTRPHTGYY
mmetsp:Transcript_20775/g.60439  ORF Transcript_20775/g.60439 Transcript_20775/m.60439 type:complete len:534 (-) Transcript_20775:770-2371(-)